MEVRTWRQSRHAGFKIRARQGPGGVSRHEAVEEESMACTIVDREGSRITIKISGKVKRAELYQVEKEAIGVIRAEGKVRLFVLLEGFQGWDNAGDWEDTSFQNQYDDQIEKIAIVGDRRWQELVEVFVGKGLRSVDIRYFTPSQTALARAWIS
jgi:hypothetical protein